MSIEVKIVHFIKGITASNKRNDKRNFLSAFSRDEDIKLFLSYMYNPYTTFGITGSQAVMHNCSDCKCTDIFMLFRMLAERKLTGNNALSAVKYYIETAASAVVAFQPEYDLASIRSIFVDIFNRNLKIGIDSTTINEVLIGLIPEFKVALAFDINKNEKYRDRISKEEYLILRKLDGVRCITIIKDHDIRFFSRIGNEFTSLGTLKRELQNFANFHRDCVLDGELCVIDDEGRENFKEAVSQIKRKNYDMENAHYKVFDYLTYQEFMGCTESPKYEDRLNFIRKRFEGLSPSVSVVGAVRYTPYNFTKAQCIVEKRGYEGLILRANQPYLAGRTSDLLKVKKFVSAEYVIEDTIATEMNMMDMNGHMVPVKCLGAFVIRHKGNPVSVGSGFTAEQRVEFLKNEEKYIGRTITVKYFEETTDAHGAASLRFPIFVGFRDTLI